VRPFQLTEGLREPAREGEVVKILEDHAVFLPQLVEAGFRVKGHRGESGFAGVICLEDIARLKAETCRFPGV